VIVSAFTAAVTTPAASVKLMSPPSWKSAAARFPPVSTWTSVPPPPPGKSPIVMDFLAFAAAASSMTRKSDVVGVPLGVIAEISLATSS
jgi:hypothetical protein